MTSIKIACLQLSLAEEGNESKIIESIQQILLADRSLNLVILSELAVSGVRPDKEKSLSTFLPLFSDLAKKYDTWLIPGTFHEFEDDVIEQRQEDIAKKNKVTLTNHSLYLDGHCEDKEACEAYRKSHS